VTGARKRVLALARTAAVLGIVAFAVMVAKDRTYVPSASFSPKGLPSREIAVVYYSRSGHSEAVAREIARTFNAPIARIDADYYARSFAGQSKALSDARAEAHPPIRVEPIDLTPVRHLFLVSPTWLFRPAPPLWSYVEEADLRSREVVLVMTGNSRYKQEEVDSFARRVEARGGRLVRSIFLRRGRIFWQMSRDELMKAVRSEMERFTQERANASKSSL
jgi:hypothetical protein